MRLLILIYILSVILCLIKMFNDDILVADSMDFIPFIPIVNTLYCLYIGIMFIWQVIDLFFINDENRINIEINDTEN